MAASRSYKGTRGKKNWIAGAVKRPGAFTRKAKAAGMSVSAYASKVLKKGSKASTRTKKQASLAKTFKKMARKRKKK
mgnify:CR=1 FL=1